MSKISYTAHLSDEGWEIIEGALAIAISRAGSKSALARGIGVEKNLPTVWMNRTRLPTIRQALSISYAYSVAPKSVRPDVDWEYVKLGWKDLAPRVRKAPAVRAGIERSHHSETVSESQ